MNAPDSAPPGTVLVFLKYPEPGRVKTRLARAVGAGRAAALYRGMIDAVFGLLQPLRPRARLVGYFDGAAAGAFAEWHRLADEWRPQPPGDLGLRLEEGFRAGNGPVLAVGTDCLEIDAGLIGEAFDLLRERDAVFGPAHDGGYYLVGTARYLPAFFDGVPWSSPDTLSAHLARCRDRGWSAGLLPPRHDIDTLGDYLAYRRRKGLADDGTEPGLPPAGGGRHPDAE